MGSYGGYLASICFFGESSSCSFVIWGVCFAVSEYLSDLPRLFNPPPSTTFSPRGQEGIRNRTEPNRLFLEPDAETNRTEPDRATTSPKNAGRSASNREIELSEPNRVEPIHFRSEPKRIEPNRFLPARRRTASSSSRTSSRSSTDLIIAIIIIISSSSSRNILCLVSLLLSLLLLLLLVVLVVVVVAVVVFCALHYDCYHSLYYHY